MFVLLPRTTHFGCEITPPIYCPRDESDRIFSGTLVLKKVEAFGFEFFLFNYFSIRNNIPQTHEPCGSQATPSFY
jgi:hypothetical protein